ncbi:MAG: efflux RND transporter periplasmic adaptor subunit [Luteimonas sp.]|nr:efflux RND transporter periplasmic adaptor subunit [Luteimonas sp.]
MHVPPFARAICLLGVVLSIAACGKDEAQAKDKQAGDRPIPVTMEVVRQQPWSDTILALGTAKARESVTVTAKVSETVQRVHFDSGDEVAKGAPLVTLTGQQQQASLTALEATAAEAERMYKRQSELAEQQLIARSSLDTQRATRDATRAQVAVVSANLADRVIRAPFAGVLGIRQVSPGTLVTPGIAIATLDDVSRVYVDFPVPEVQLANLATGQALGARSNSYPGRTFEGIVSTIDARIDPATRAVTVRGDFPNPDRALRPGMLLEVQLSRPERQALVVPEIALVQVGADTFVYRVKADGSVERPRIEVGGRTAGKVEVSSGLKAGDRIVVDGTGKLSIGSKVVQGAPAQAQATPSATQG